MEPLVAGGGSFYSLLAADVRTPSTEKPLGLFYARVRDSSRHAGHVVRTYGLLTSHTALLPQSVVRIPFFASWMITGSVIRATTLLVFAILGLRSLHGRA
jgi:hypothetical protein